jgi:hypothetical protein
MLKKFGKLEGKKKFDIKKFISRAVGWKMRDMLSCAITEAEKVTSPRNKFYDSKEEIGYEFVEKIEQERSPSLKYGFSMKGIYKHFSGKDLTILQNMIKYNCRKRDIARLYPNDSWFDIKYVWKTRIKPKIKSILAKIQKERK